MRRKPNTFQFKGFTIQQDRTTHKVGTDGVLLGAWCDVSAAKSILDVGTGTGVIALMLAQRTPTDTHIDAIEIEKADAEQAIENVLRSPWSEKITVHHASLQTFNAAPSYDLIVSNPPFFLNSELPPDRGRTQARHTQTLSFDELISFAAARLTERGKLSIILPPVEAQIFQQKAKSFVRLQRQCSFRSREHKPIERLLMEFSMTATSALEAETLTLYSEGNEWSEAYKNLTHEFYLKI